MFSDKERDSWRTGLFIKIIPLIFFLISLISFGKEYLDIFNLFAGTFLYAIGLGDLPNISEILTSLPVIIFNLFLGAGLFFVVWILILSSQALLPVSGFIDIAYTAMHLVIYILRYHGAAIIVRDGKLRATPDELLLPFPGVAVVDFNSAMVLERVVVPPGGCLTVISGIMNEAVGWFMGLLGSTQSVPDAVRVCGPGLTFIEATERIQGAGELDKESESVEDISGVVDLRRQFRISRRQSSSHPELLRTSVRGYTRDGIELNTNINALFTIGQNPNLAPHVLQVVYQGEPILANLRILVVDEKNNRVRIKSLNDELDDADKAEIDQFIKDQLKNDPVKKTAWAFEDYKPIEMAPREPIYNADQVFSAVYSRARQKFEEPLLLWTELPVHVATDFFREILSSVNFDELYQLDASGNLIINDLRRQLRVRMRSCSLLSYRFVAHSHQLQLDVGKEYLQSELRVSPIQSLKAPKVLRDRGILIIAAGFGDLIPDNIVFKQWLASWRATWERDTITSQAVADLEVIRIQNRARAQAQDDLAISLREIFRTDNYSREAIAIRILQALESIAADSETRQLLPEETLSMLRNIHDWLLPEDTGRSFDTLPKPPSFL